MTRQQKILSSALKSLTIDRLSIASHVDVKTINLISSNTTNWYVTKNEFKKGKINEFSQPIFELEPVIKSLCQLFKQEVTLPEHIHGWRKSKSIITNANLHIGKRYLLTSDISNYFPTVTQSHIKKTMIWLGMNTEMACLISRLCTLHNSLPKGVKTSDAIANIVFLPVDFSLLRLSQKFNATYSRYGDDLTFSSNSNLDRLGQLLVPMVRKAGFQLSLKKTRHSHNYERQLVTGVVVNEKKRPTKIFLKQLSSDIKTTWQPNGLRLLANEFGTTPQKTLDKLWGRVNYVRQFDRKLYRKFRGLMVPVNNSH